MYIHTYMKSVELLDDFGEFAVGFSLDSPGYTAADLATLAGFHATAEKINALGAANGAAIGQCGHGVISVEEMIT